MSGAIGVHSVAYYWTRPLFVRYLGPTAGGRGARLIVRDDFDGRRVVVPYRYDLDTAGRVVDAVTKWLYKHGGGAPGAAWVVVATGGASWVAVPMVGRPDFSVMDFSVSADLRGVES